MRGFIIAGICIVGILFLLVRKDSKEKATVTNDIAGSPSIIDHTQRSLEDITLEQEDIITLDDAIHSTIVGMDQVLYGLYIGLLVPGGHILLEGVPGLAKTKIINSLAQLLHLSTHRIQCTPDMLPADIVGVDMFDQQKQSFHFVKGPVFANVVLADEINRTTPKVQSALLEAMEEQQVTAGGTTYSLPDPFIVFATQNPLEQSGTYELPEAQQDRFLLHIVVDYPTHADEEEMLAYAETKRALPSALFDASKIARRRQEVAAIDLDESMKAYIVRLVQATRKHTDLQYGASPRASLALMHASKAVARLQDKESVDAGDIQSIALMVLRHRVILTYAAQAAGKQRDEVLMNILDQVA